jgi:excisionase family DNA binding protein
MAVSSLSNGDYVQEGNLISSRCTPGQNHLSAGADSSRDAASPHTATGDGRQDEGRLLTVHEVAALLQVPTSWVYARTRKRSAEHLPGYRLGKYWRFRREDIFAWIDRQRGTRNAT